MQCMAWIKSRIKAPQRSCCILCPLIADFRGVDDIFYKKWVQLWEFLLSNEITLLVCNLLALLHAIQLLQCVCLWSALCFATHSEMWTKISSPPWDGWMKPWPCDLEKFLHVPLKTGPEWARTVLRAGRGKQTNEPENDYLYMIYIAKKKQVEKVAS